MNCDDGIRNRVLALAAGELPPAEALETERHLAACPACAALRLAALEERAALKEAGAPLRQAGPAFASQVMAAAATGENRGRRAAAAALAFAAGFAVLMLFMPHGRAPVKPAPSSLNPLYAANLAGGGAPADSVLGDLKGSTSDLFYMLSCRRELPAAGGAVINLKTGGQEGL
jgi:anti-sigma factor RsiW